MGEKSTQAYAYIHWTDFHPCFVSFDFLRLCTFHIFCVRRLASLMYPRSFGDTIDMTCSLTEWSRKSVYPYSPSLTIALSILCPLATFNVDCLLLSFLLLLLTALWALLILIERLIALILQTWELLLSLQPRMQFSTHRYGILTYHLSVLSVLKLCVEQNLMTIPLLPLLIW